jgi:hypothetical protein
VSSANTSIPRCPSCGYPEHGSVACEAVRLPANPVPGEPPEVLLKIIERTAINVLDSLRATHVREWITVRDAAAALLRPAATEGENP